MTLWRMTMAEAVEKADHLIALGETEFYLHEGEERPWDFVTEVESGGTHRLSGPASVTFKAAHPCGVTFRWSEDFEPRSANGAGRHLFDRDHMRDIARKLPKEARQKFADFLRREVLPGVQKLTREIRHSLNQQQDSEDCLHGLIKFAADDDAEAAA